MTDQPPPTQAAGEKQPSAGDGTTKRFLSRREDIQAWFHDRTWSMRGDMHPPTACRAKTVLFPTSAAADVSAILRDLPPGTPVSVVCGGHSSSNASTAACPGAIVLDLQTPGELTAVTVDSDLMQVKVGGGVLFRQLAEAVRDAGGALPLGTGDTVGVAGYVTNGGISGYFQKRLGMLGQRVQEMTVVLADGTVRELSSQGGDQELFRAMLGAGSALGVVTSLTLQMESGSIFRTGGNLVVACETLESAQAYARKALAFLMDTVLPNPSVSMELVVTADYTCIVTLVFYDTFEGNPVDFAKDLREAGGEAVVVDDVISWTKWFEAASSLWPVIAEMKGEPLIRMDHCMGMRKACSNNEVLEFAINDWIGRMPFALANQSIVEIRTLGGAVQESTQTQTAVPAGNAHCQTP